VPDALKSAIRANLCPIQPNSASEAIQDVKERIHNPMVVSNQNGHAIFRQPKWDSKVGSMTPLTGKTGNQVKQVG